MSKRLFCKVLLVNKKNTFNEKLIKFFKDHLEQLNSKNIVFDWIAVYEDEIELYSDQNITRFPCLIVNDNNIFGTNAIINFLMGKIKQPNIRGKNKINRPENEDEVRDFLLHEIKETEKDEDMDEDDKFRNNIAQKMADMNKMRGRMGQHTMSQTNPEMHEKMAPKKVRFEDQTPVKKNTEYTSNQPSPAEIIKKTSNGDMDDDLMARFWENNELTEI